LLEDIDDDDEDLPVTQPAPAQTQSLGNFVFELVRRIDIVFDYFIVSYGMTPGSNFSFVLD
jgi:hypothetical protein